MKKLILFIIPFFLFSCEQEYGDYIEPLSPESDYQSGEKYTDYGENAFIDANEQAVSTFAIDADGASYANMRRYASVGRMPPVESVRLEEYINYFNFDYPEPTNENVSLHTEASICPWNNEHQLLRIGMKGKKLAVLPASNIVLLVDVSGSMDDPEKLGLVQTGFKAFVDQMKNQDRIAIVTYAGSSEVVLQSTNGDSKADIKAAIDRLSAAGSTNGEGGIITAYEIAQKNFIPNGNNRVIIASDGDFNVGASTTDELVTLIESKRDLGIYLTVIGVGSGNLNDAMMEQLANKGNGNFEYIDNIHQLKKVFMYEFEKFYTVAKDCKIQITFNAEEISAYRLIGYENRVLNQEEFENDSTDAGEIGSNQSITALYELIPTQNSGDYLGMIEFRYKMPETEENRVINYEVSAGITSFELSSENMRFAASVAGLGLLFKESEFKGNLTYEKVYDWANNSRTFDPFRFRKEFVDLVANVSE